MVELGNRQQATGNRQQFKLSTTVKFSKNVGQKFTILRQQ